MDLVKDIYAYHYVSQGKTTVNGIDDDEEMKMTDVSEVGFCMTFLPVTMSIFVDRLCRVFGKA